MGKAKNQTVGYKYYMGIHMGMGRGPVDELCEIKVGDRQAWQGSVTGNASFSIKKPDLFGGTKGEGGIDGSFDLMMGGASQVKSSKLAAMLSGDQPEFRGIVTAFFDGMICAMNPYPKKWAFRVRRILQGWDGAVWYPEKAKISLTGRYADGGSREVIAMNPVHIIYEALTNRGWGLGRDRSLFLDAAWKAAADKLYDEKFGLCIRWGRQDTLMSFVQTVIDHIGCAVYVDKFTGKFTIKMIRDDYDADSLPVFDTDSGLLQITEATNASPFNLVNEIIVTGFNPVTNETFQVRQHNLALIQTQGAINSDTRDYPGLPTPELALRIAQRDLKAASTNIRRFTIVCDRRAWHTQPGDVIKIRDPQSRGIETVILRIGNVEESGQTDGAIKLTGVQDVFGADLNTFADVQPPGHFEPPADPDIARTLVYEAPYAELVRFIPEGEFNTIKAMEGYIRAHAEKPTPICMAFDLAVRPQGQADFVVNGNGDFTPLAELGNQIGYLDTQLTYDKEEFEDEEDIYVGMTLMIGDRDTHEIVRLDAWDPVQKTFTIARGCMDTIPQRHFGGELIWAIEDNGGSDWTRYLSGETVEMKILPWTLRGGRFPIDDAPIDELTFRHRFIRPYAPGHVLTTTMAGGQKRWYENQDLRYDVGPTEVPDFITITWTHRDRPVQQDKLIDHEQGDIGPEPGTTYRLRVFNAKGELVRTETGIDGTQFIYTYAMASADTKVEEGSPESAAGTMFLDAMRSGYNSWMYYTLPFTVHKKPPQTANVAQLAMATAGEDTEITSGEDADIAGGQVAQLLMSTAQVDSDIVSGDDADIYGAQLAQMATAAGQSTKLPPIVDFYLYEAPYLTLLRDGRNSSRSQMLAFVARPSDRTTDGFDFFSRDSAEQNWTTNGSQPWTPWGVLKGFIQHLGNELEVDATSDTDGVPIDTLQPNDIILVDNELLVVQTINGKRIRVGRGSADTIPAPHYAGAVVWLFDRQHAASNQLFADEATALGNVRPHAFAEPLLPADMPTKQLKMQYRPNRPYPPGLMLANGLHWYERIRGIPDDMDYTAPEGKAVTLTWAHRNRISQGQTAYDHLASGIAPENGVRYRVWVGYTVSTQTSSSKVTLFETEVEDAGITFSKAQLELWGPRAGYALKSGGVVALQVAVNAVRDGLFNWQGYGMTMLAPSYPLPPGEKPGTNVPPEPNYPNPGSPAPNPNNPNPTPPGDGGTTDPTPDPENPDPNPDPEVPDTDPPEPPEPPEPDPDNVFGWSNMWDHGWAAALPDQSVTGE